MRAIHILSTSPHFVASQHETRRAQVAHTSSYFGESFQYSEPSYDQCGCIWFPELKSHKVATMPSSWIHVHYTINIRHKQNIQRKPHTGIFCSGTAVSSAECGAIIGGARVRRDCELCSDQGLGRGKIFFGRAPNRHYLFRISVGFRCGIWKECFENSNIQTWSTTSILRRIQARKPVIL